MGDGRKEEEGIEKGVAGDDVRVNDKNLSTFTVAFSISGSLRRSTKKREGEGKRVEKREDSKRDRSKALPKKKGRITPNKNIRQGCVKYGEPKTIRYPFANRDTLQKNSDVSEKIFRTIGKTGVRAKKSMHRS